MSESVLKKEFKGADLQRLRNLVQGKMGEKTSVSDVPSPKESVSTFSRIGLSFQRFPTALKKSASKLNLKVNYKVNTLSWLGEREYIFTLIGKRKDIDKCIKILDEQFDVEK